MNPTIEKFGFPETLLREFNHWVVLLRPAQVTLGSLVIAAKSDVTAFGELPVDAFTELGKVVASSESAVRTFSGFEKINYLMLMMVDPNVHFHVIPRYSKPRSWGDLSFPDQGWPGAPQLGTAIQLTPAQIERIAAKMIANFR